MSDFILKTKILRQIVLKLVLTGVGQELQMILIELEPVL